MFTADEIEIDSYQPSQGDKQRELVKKMYDEGRPMFEIAEALGDNRSRVTAIIKEVYSLLGENLPDRRGRRATLVTMHKKPPLYQAIADDVMKLLKQGFLIVEVAKELNVNRDTITSSIKHWHKKRGLPVPDGRALRQSFSQKES